MRELDRLADGALPALEQVERDGWLLRATPGGFKRSNSARALSAEPGPLDVVEHFYRERGLPPRVTVSDPALDARLASWRQHDRVQVLAGPLPPGGAEARLEVEVRDAPWDAWTDCCSAVDGRPEGRAALLAQLALVRQDSAYAAVHDAGRVVAAGRGALAEGWLGVFAMAVLPAHRGRGHGRTVLRALSGWAADRRGTRCYLQVLEDNAAARQLYASAGLRPDHAYWYRSAPAWASRPRPDRRGVVPCRGMVSHATYEEDR